MKSLGNWIIIAGNGRNTGKTTLACRIIDRSKKAGVIGIKISPHHHPVPDDALVLGRTGKSIIIRENRHNSKDSSRMLQAGASEVYYVQCGDEALPEVLDQLEKLTGGRPVVCESGGLRKYIDPAFFFMVMSPKNQDKNSVIVNLAYKPVVTDMDKIIRNNDVGNLLFIDNEWKQSNII